MGAGKQQTAVVTGGAGTLARAIAASLLHEPGWAVESPAKSELDVRDASSVSGFFNGRDVDFLVCAAGITRDATLAKLGEDAWDDVWQTNYEGALRCAQAVLPGMVARKTGHILFVSSYSAIHPPPGQAAYAAAKAALLGLTADLARGHGDANIRVNALLPGFLETRMTQSVTARRRSEVLAAHALGRFNTCREVADFVCFLHHRLPHTSGQAFQLDSRPACI